MSHDGDDISHSRDPHVMQEILVQILQHVHPHPVIVEDDGVVGDIVPGDPSISEEPHPLLHTRPAHPSAGGVLDGWIGMGWLLVVSLLSGGVNWVVNWMVN